MLAVIKILYIKYINPLFCIIHNKTLPVKRIVLSSPFFVEITDEIPRFRQLFPVNLSSGLTIKCYYVKISKTKEANVSRKEHMKQTVLFDSYFKDFFKTEEKIAKTLAVIKGLADKGKDYLKSYDYIVKCTEIYNSSDEDDAVARFVILSMYGDGKNDFLTRDEAFVSFYLVCFHFYRQRDTKALRTAINKYIGKEKNQFSIDEYPIIWDIACRYSVLTNDYERLLINAVLGARAMDNSAAMCNSYVQAVCNKAKSLYYKNSKKVDKDYPACLSQNVETTGTSPDYAETLIRAYEYAFNSIDKNPDYAKYYYNVAELLFYTRVFLSEKSEELTEVHKNGFVEAIKKIDADVTFDDLSSGNSFTEQYVEKYISAAKSRTENESEISSYNQFLDMASAFFFKRPDNIFAKKNRIITANSFDDCISLVKSSDNTDYITISYSRKDFKPVLCDIIELQSRGVQVLFDERLEKTASKSGKTWSEKYEKILAGSKAVLCFLSENYIQSSAVEEELVLMQKYNKTVIAIDLSGKKKISEIIKSAILKGATLPSSMLKALTGVFGDKELSISREKNVDAIGHFEKLNVLLHDECGEVFKIVKAEGETDRNVSQSPHPQEDALFLDDVNNIYVIADGITRQEGYESDYSLAAAFSNEFTSTFSRKLAESMKLNSKNPEELIKKCFVNSSVLTQSRLEKDGVYTKAKAAAKALSVKNGTYFEAPGCVAAVAVIDNGTLYYGSVGDCAVTLIRNGQPAILTRNQTAYAFNVDKHEADRELLYERYVNKPGNKHGYGVVNGDRNVSAFFTVGSVKLTAGDYVYIMSDGIKDFFIDSYEEAYNSLLLSEIFALHKGQTNGDLDDRTIIRIQY